MSNSSSQPLSSQSQASQAAPESFTMRSRSRSSIELPGENLTIEETLRVLDVARELRNRRETAEEMFRRDDIRTNLRQKLMQAAAITGDKVTEAEIDLAISHYLSSVHQYQDPAPGIQSVLAHLWVWRSRVLLAAGSLAVMAGGLWFLFA